MVFHEECCDNFTTTKTNLLTLIVIRADTNAFFPRNISMKL